MTIKVGLIGAGVMGADHARLLCSAVSGAELVAVSDPDARRAAQVQQLGTSVRVLADPLALVRDTEVDAVLIASPDETHSALVLACLELGKPVLCEKPLAATPEECARIVEKEAALGRRLITVGFMRRFDPGYVEMKRRLNEGSLGAALIMHCIHRNKVTPSFISAPMLMTSSCVHEIDISRFVLGQEIRCISVTTPRKSALSSIADPQIVLMEMADGVIVDVEVFLNAQYGYDVRGELVYVATAVAFSGLDALAKKSSVEIHLAQRPAIYDFI